jgi:hypothetical protein
MKDTFVHSGYELKLDEIEEKYQMMLKPLLTNHVVRRKKDGPQEEVLKLRRRPYTAIKYNTSSGWYRANDSENKSDAIKSWFSSRINKPMNAYINFLFIDPKKKVVVAQGTIDGQHTYITISQQDHKFRPIQVKKMANTGKLGAQHRLDAAIVVPCRVYAYTNKKGMIFAI